MLAQYRRDGRRPNKAPGLGLAVLNRALFWLLFATLTPAWSGAATADFGVTISASPTTVPDANGSSIYTITKESGLSGLGVYVYVAVGGTATLGTDYSLEGLHSDSGSGQYYAYIDPNADQLLVWLSSLGSGANVERTATLALTDCIADYGQGESGSCEYSGSATVTIQAGGSPAVMPELAIVSGKTQTLDEGEAVAPLVVEVTADGSPLSGAGVSWSSSAGTSVLSATHTNTDSSGRTSVMLTPDGPGTFTVDAKLDETGQTRAFSVMVNESDGPHEKLAIHSGNDQVITAGQSLAPFVVEVTENGEPLSGAQIDWAIVDGNGSLSTTRSTTDGQGHASTTLTPTGTGEISVEATLAGTDMSVTFGSPASPLSSLPGLSPSEREVGGVVESACPALAALSQQRALTSGEQDLYAVCTALLNASVTNPGAAAQGITALTPRQFSARRNVSLVVATTQVDNVIQRLANLRAGARGFDFRGLGFSVDGQRVSGSTIASMLDALGERGGGASADDDGFERLGLFINGNLSWGDKDETTNSGGYGFDTLGLTAGVDYRFTQGLVLGAAMGWASTDVAMDANGGGLDATEWSATLYGTWYPTDSFYLEGSATYGWDDYDQTRNIVYSLLGTPRSAEADYGGSQYSLMLGAGYDRTIGASIIDLYGRLEYTKASFDSYRENGAGGLDLNIGEQEASSTKSVLGLQYTHSFSLPSVVLVPQAWFEWAHEFEGGDDSVTGTFVYDPNQARFEVATDAFDTDAFKLGLGVGALFGRGRTAFISYEAALGLHGYREQNINAGVRLDF